VIKTKTTVCFNAEYSQSPLPALTRAYSFFAKLSIFWYEVQKRVSHEKNKSVCEIANY